MNRFSLISIALLAVVLGGPMASSFAVTVLSQPDCPSLQIWAEGLIPGETSTPLPGIDPSSLFKDERLMPVFGKSILSWEREDLNPVLGWLANCLLSNQRLLRGTKLF